MEFISKITKKDYSEGLKKDGVTPYKRCQFEFENGKKLSTFEDTIANAHMVGSTVKVTTKTAKNPQYEDLVKMEPSTVAEGKAFKPEEPVLNAETTTTHIAETANTDLLRQILAKMTELCDLAAGEPR
jgi:hypothetical protein